MAERLGGSKDEKKAAGNDRMSLVRPTWFLDSAG
jgi:hypothetical protein